MKIAIRFIIIIFLLNNSFVCYSQGKLDKSKEELKKGSKRSKRDSRSSGYPSSDSDDSGSLCGDLFGGLITRAFLYSMSAVFIGLYEDEDHLHNRLSRYPYFNSSSGNYQSDLVYGNVMRLDVENKLLASQEDIYANHLKVKFRPFRFFSIQGDYHQLMELNRTDDSRSYLSLYNLDFCYDRVRAERFNLGWTVGMNYVGDDVNMAGFAGGLNTDIFLFNKTSLYSSMRWGIINDVPVNEFEIQFKYHIKNFSLSLGYENLKIGTPVYDFITFGVGIYLGGEI